MKNILLTCASLFLLLPFVSKGQDVVTLENSQEEIVAVIQAIMAIAQQEKAVADASPITLRPIETVRAISGQEYTLEQAKEMTSMLVLEDNHIKVTPKYRDMEARWDGVSFDDLAKALDDFRSNELTSQQVQ